MEHLMIASDEEDLRAAEKVEEHHRVLSLELALEVGTVLEAAREASQAELSRARDRLVAWCRRALLPHAAAEERVLYAAAAGAAETRLLVTTMVGEHRLLVDLVDELETASHPVSLAGSARALKVVFDNHVAKENEQLLPQLVAAPGVSLATLLEGMHEQLEASGTSPAAAAEGHDCSCHEEEPDRPELDARVIPHALRHSAVFGALDAVRPGNGMVLVAPHDPLPLLAQLERRSPGAFAVRYLQRGPEAWRLAVTRRGGRTEVPG